MLLENEELRDHSQGVTLTYTEAYTLNEAAFEDVATASPLVWTKVSHTYLRTYIHTYLPTYLLTYLPTYLVWTKVSRAMRRVALTRALIRHLHMHTKDWKPRSFVPRSVASGFETAANPLLNHLDVDSAGPVPEDDANKEDVATF